MKWLLVLWLGVIAVSSPLLAAPIPNAALITMKGPGLTTGRIDKVVVTAAKGGGHIYHVMPVRTACKEIGTCLLIGSLPSQLEPSILSLSCVTAIQRSGVKPDDFASMGAEAVAAAGAWNTLVGGATKIESLIQQPVPAMMDDTRTSPQHGTAGHSRTMAAAGSTSSVGASPSPPGVYQTSEYMIRKVVIGIILPESDGSVENWTDGGGSRQAAVYNAIVSGANWWATQGGPSADLTFYYDTHYSVPTQYEPITMSASNEGTWIADVMSNMGYEGNLYYDQVYDYVNAIRTSYQTDWAFAVFVADSYHDTDGRFADGSFAYSYLFGPFMVLTYDNDGWGISRMNQVFAHEMGHIFGAADEYAGVSTCNASTCDNLYGYLGSLNGNCAACTANQQACIMVSDNLSVAPCAYTRAQVGWLDTDDDGIYDPVDTTPTAAATVNYTNEPYTTQAEIQGQGVVQDQPCPSPTREPVSINTVTAAYSVDGGDWTTATPNDGTFDGLSEPFTFTTSPQADGPHQVIVRATNTAGNTAEAAPLEITTDTTPPPPPASVADTGAGTDQYDHLTFSWPAALDTVSGISGYILAIRDQNGTDILGEQPVGNVLSYTANGLTLVPGTKYYAVVKSQNGAGLTSATPSESNGIMAVTFYPSIGALKTSAASGAPVGLASVYVSSSGSDNPGVVYLQQGTGVSGIRTDNAQDIPRGTNVQVAGYLLNELPDGELCITQSLVEPVADGASKTIGAVALTGRSCGGSTFGLQPGVTGGIGLNTIGSLVTVFGKVTYATTTEPYYYTIDDGSGAVDSLGHPGVGVRSYSTAPPSVDSNTWATGICSYELGFPVVLIR